MTDRSFGEVEQTLCKAIEGAGLPYGIALKFARAAVRMESHGLPGTRAFLSLVKLSETGSLAQPVSPRVNYAFLTPLSAVVTFDLLVAGDADSVTFELARTPLAAAGLASLAATQCKCCVSILSTDGLRLLVGSDGLRCQGDVSATAMGMSISMEPWRAVGSTTLERPCIDETTWDELLELANRRLVPHNPESRAHGAGAGLLDND